MKKFVKAAMLAGAAWGAMSAVAVAQDAPSQEPEVTSVDDIIVSARRRDEALKDVPVAVTALGGARLEQTGGTDLTVLQQQTPNATVQVARGSNSTLISFIRGVGQQDPLWGFEPGVGLYIDDVYVARPQGAVLDVFDIQRIEVLRGPQGSLYGRNTVGGAIKYVTSRLSPETEVSVKAAYGSFNQIDFLGRASVPLSDDFRVGAAVARYTRDGYGTNLNTGAEHYDKDVTAFRASAEWTPRDEVFVRLTYDRTADDSAPRHGHRELAGVGVGAGVQPSVYDTFAGVGDENSVETEGFALTVQAEVSDNWTVKAIAAVREEYDYILIDCPPSLGLITVNMLAAADALLIPVQCEYYALEGLSQLLNTVHLIQRNVNPALGIDGVLLTMYDARLNLSRQVATDAREYFGPKVFESIIPRNVRLSP